MLPPPTPIRRSTQTLGIASASGSRQRKFTPAPFSLNHPSLSGVTEPPHQGASAVTTFPMTPLPPGTPRRPPSHMEHQTQSGIPRPSAQFTRQNMLPQQRMGFRTGTTMGSTTGPTQGLSSVGQAAPRVAGLNRLPKPNGGGSVGGLGFGHES